MELSLRQQLAIYAQRQSRPRLSPLDRAFWVALSRLWPRWKSALVVVQPETVLRWHREGFRRYWRAISTPGPGRPPIPEETRHLILEMATENAWRARKIPSSRRPLREYVEYYNAERVHTSLGDAPAGRAADTKPSDRARVVGLPRVGGLHHRYAWREAA